MTPEREAIFNIVNNIIDNHNATNTIGAIKVFRIKEPVKRPLIPYYALPGLCPNGNSTIVKEVKYSFVTFKSKV